MDPLYPGQRILVEIKYYYAGVPTDPTVARCLIINPVGSQTVLTYPAATFTRREQGFFEASVSLDLPGPWQFRAESAGVVDSATETTIVVSSSSFS